MGAWEAGAPLLRLLGTTQGCCIPGYEVATVQPLPGVSEGCPGVSGGVRKDFVVLWSDACWVHVLGLLLRGVAAVGSPSQKRKCRTEEAPAALGSSV